MCIEVDISKIKDKSIIDKISVNVEKMNMDTEYIDIYAINQSDEFIAYRLKEPVKDHSVTIYFADHSIQKYIIAYVPVNNLSLNYDVINLKKGEEITLTCDLNENATNSQLHAQVRDSNIIEVSSNGTIKAINAGTTQLIIQSYKNSVTKVIDVIVKEIPTDIILDKENIEIERIIKELSSLFYPYSLEIEKDIQYLKKLDFIFAKARYSKEIKGNQPIINTNKQIILEQARHPLIDKNIVVPIDLSLGTTYYTLVITGPNTGGKTVSLKTVGLLHLMAYSGIMIPANENSSIFIFDNIFADIGDNQSISESLSTFSSHIKTIINITNHATCQSLILVDELGSGTDPIEGSSLAISILEFFHNLGALCISTTHYQEIKNYALTHDGYINASAEFDVENLKPTYHIILGIPGKSNAFAISQKLGLNKKILDRAISLVDSNDIKIEDILKNIYDTKSEIEKQKEKIDSDTLEIEKLKLVFLELSFQIRNCLYTKSKEKQVLLQYPNYSMVIFLQILLQKMYSDLYPKIYSQEP